MLLDGRIAHAAGLNSPADYALELKLGRPLNSKDPISLEVAGKLCVNSGLEITAGQRTMSGLIADLTGQTFFLPVILTGQNSIVLKMK